MYSGGGRRYRSDAITPSEGQALASLIEVQRKAIETVEIEQRLAALEQSVGPK